MQALEIRGFRPLADAACAVAWIVAYGVLAYWLCRLCYGHALSPLNPAEWQAFWALSAGLVFGVFASSMWEQWGHAKAAWRRL
jgi:hypothetical protein